MYIPLSDPLPAIGLASFMFVVILEGVSGTVTYQAAYRTYETGKDDAGAWSDLGSSNSTSDWNSTVLSVTPGTKLYAQPGLKITSTGGRATAHVMVSRV